MHGSSAGTHGAANQNARTAADQSAHEHATGGAAAEFKSVAPVVACPLELALSAHVGALDVGVDQRCVEEVALAGGKNHGFGKNPDSRFTGDATRFIHLRDATFDGRSHWDQGAAVDDDGLRDLGLKGI